MSFFLDIFKNLLLERPGRKHDYASWARELEQAGALRLDQYENSADSEKHRDVLRHVIGIERWAQQRLRVAVGDEFVDGEHDLHSPGKDESWSKLQKHFAAARSETVTLAKELASKEIPTSLTIQHNQFGDVTTRGWLRYMFMHANFESRAIKTR